jgi:hypothetical protein
LTEDVAIDLRAGCRCVDRKLNFVLRKNRHVGRQK